jgi:hypothetical protein
MFSATLGRASGHVGASQHPGRSRPSHRTLARVVVQRQPAADAAVGPDGLPLEPFWGGVNRHWNLFVAKFRPDWWKILGKALFWLIFPPFMLYEELPEVWYNLVALGKALYAGQWRDAIDRGLGLAQHIFNTERPVAAQQRFLRSLRRGGPRSSWRKEGCATSQLGHASTRPSRSSADPKCHDPAGEAGLGAEEEGSD